MVQPKSKRLVTEAGLDAETAANRWDSKSSLPSLTRLDEPLAVGVTSTALTSHPGIPAAQVGSVESRKVSAASQLQYVTWGSTPRLFIRNFMVDGTPYPWREFAGVLELDAVAARVLALEGSPGAGSGASGMKIVPLTMTAPGTPLTTTTTEGAVRWARRYATMPKRVRVHVSNANTGNSLTGNTALTVGSIRVGVGDAAGGYTQGVTAQAGGTLATDGSEIVSPWVTVSSLEDGGYIAVSVSWTGGGGTAILQNNHGGGWVSTSAAAVGNATTAGWTRQQTTPLHCWIEAEVPASTPVLLGQGDSITVGSVTTDPIGDSWVSVYAYNMGALPVILAMHGSTMTQWTPGASRWTQYGGFDLKSAVDAVVTTLGQNDLTASGIDLVTLQSRHTAFMAALRGAFPRQPIYLGTITPSNKSAALEQIRRDFNSWRATSAQQERGILSFATAVGGPTDEDLLPEYTSDGLHPNTAGQALMASRAEEVPVTPFTLSPAKLKALA